MKVTKVKHGENAVAKVEYISFTSDNDKITWEKGRSEVVGMSHTLVTNKITGLFEGFNDHSKAHIFYDKITKHFLHKEGLIEMASIVKPCAFCGSKGELQKQKCSVKNEESTIQIKYVVFCSQCYTKGEWNISQEEAMKSWDKKYPTFSQFEGEIK